MRVHGARRVVGGLVSVYCELERLIYSTLYGVYHIRLGLGVLGGQYAGSRGVLAEYLLSAREELRSNPWIMLTRDRRFFRG